MRTKVLIVGIVMLAVGIALSRGIQHVHFNSILDPEIYGGIIAAAGIASVVVGALTKRASPKAGP